MKILGIHTKYIHHNNIKSQFHHVFYIIKYVVHLSLNVSFYYVMYIFIENFIIIVILFNISLKMILDTLIKIILCRYYRRIKLKTRHTIIISANYDLRLTIIGNE